jgi:hypothetical protein
MLTFKCAFSQYNNINGRMLQELRTSSLLMKKFPKVASNFFLLPGRACSMHLRKSMYLRKSMPAACNMHPQ